MPDFASAESQLVTLRRCPSGAGGSSSSPISRTSVDGSVASPCRPSTWIKVTMCRGLKIVCRWGDGGIQSSYPFVMIDPSRTGKYSIPHHRRSLVGRDARDEGIARLIEIESDEKNTSHESLRVSGLNDDEAVQTFNIYVFRILGLHDDQAVQTLDVWFPSQRRLEDAQTLEAVKLDIDLIGVEGL